MVSTSIDPRLQTQFRHDISEQDNTPGKVDAEEARELVNTAVIVDDESFKSKCCGLIKSGGKKGRKDLRRLVDTHADRFEPTGRDQIEHFLRTGKIPPPPEVVVPFGGERLMFEWRCAKPTWHAPWWPMKERVGSGGDPRVNLFASNGPLEKYDTAFGHSSRAYELRHNKKSFSSGKKFDWWGHCNNASEVACLLREPRRSVNLGGVTFTPRDIKGLLCKVSSSLSERTDFEGRRYRGPSGNPDDPTPSVFLEKILRAWGDTDNPIPFALDIDREEQVWNYPYDQGKIYQSKTAPEGFDESRLPSGGELTFYRAELNGTGFARQARNYQFWIQTDQHGTVLKGGWIKGDDPHISPDFGWRPNPNGDGDFTREENWPEAPDGQNNPHVLPRDVYKLYMASI